MTFQEIKNGIFAWIDNVKPAHDSVDIDLDADLVTGNQIIVTVNGTALTPVNFTTDHQTTMELIATEIETDTDVDTATVLPISTDPYRRIRVKGIAETDMDVDTVAITGGATQPTETITRTERIREITWADQDDPAPVEPFIELRITSLIKVGEDYQAAPDAGGDVIMTGNREFTLMVRGFGPDAYQDMLDLMDSIELDATEQILFDNELVIFDHEAVMDLSVVIGTAFSNQAGIDFFMRYGHGITDDGRGEITSAVVTGELTEGDNDPIATTLTVTKT